MQQEFTIGKAYYLYLDTPYCDKWLSRKNEKKREMRIELPWPWLSTVHGISSYSTLNLH